MATSRRLVRWSLHEATQRALCQMAFLLAGAMPVLLSLVFVGVQYLPAYQHWQTQRWEKWLQQQLGITARIAAIETLAPNRLKLHGIKLTHPESQATIGRLRQIELLFSARGCAVSLTKPEFDARQLKNATKIIHDWCVCRTDRYAQSLSIQVDQSDPLSIFGMEAESVNFSDVQIDLFPDTKAIVAKVEFRRADLRNSEPIVLFIKREHGEIQPETRIELQTGGTPLPCWLLAKFVPAVESLGARAEFTGQFALSANGDEVRAEILRTTIQGIDLGRWTSSLPSPLLGQGQLYLERALLTRAGLESADGQLQASNGRISQGLLVAARQYLGVVLTDDGQVTAPRFENFGLRFQVSAKGLTLVGLLGPLAGAASDSGMRSFVSDLRGGFAATSYHDPIPIENLVATCNAAPGLVVTAAGGGSSQEPGSHGWWIPKWLALGRTDESQRITRANSQHAQPTTSPRDSSVTSAVYK